MKKILPILLFYILYTTINAQNYRCIKTDAITHFQNINGNIVSIRIDSTYQNSDTVDYISYHLIRSLDNNHWDYTIKGASWIGEKFRVLQNGDNIFYNALHEPIVIKTHAYINTTWEMYHSNLNNIVVNATISNIQSISFLGLIDSVATINFYVTDTSGIAIQNPVNNYSLMLSKNYGLISIFNFYTFPFVNQIGVDDLYGFSDTLNLIGINDTNNGWQNITAYDVYNWQPGWEFHSSESHSPPIGPGEYTGYYTNMIRKILNKTLTADSISYTVDRCFYNRVYNNTDSIISENHSHDTIVETYNLDSPLNQLSYEPIIYDSNNITFHIKTTNTIMEQGWIFTNLQNDTCQPLNYDGYTNLTWKVGFGSTYHGEGFLGDQSDYIFVYYKKDSIEWGTPYICSTLLNIESINTSENDIKIYPNPNDGKFILENVNPYQTSIIISIIDITGQTVYMTTIPKAKYYLNIQDLSDGIYTVKIQTDSYILVKKLIKN